MAAMDEEETVVYLNGREEEFDVWFRVVLDTKGKSKEETETISPVASLPLDLYGYRGSWTVIGDDIYWAGGTFYSDKGCNFNTVCKYLLKHNFYHPDLTYWEEVTILNIPRESPYLAAVGRKVAIVAGKGCRTKPIIEEEEVDDERWRKWGEIYDLDKKTLSYLSSGIEKFEHHYLANTVAEDEEAKQVVFYSLDHGSMLILDASTSDIVKHGDPDLNLVLKSSQALISPQGRLRRRTTRPLRISRRPLRFAICGSPAVLHDRAFYYFSDELRLYSYDVDLRKWFRSECLFHKLFPLRPKHEAKFDYQMHTLLLVLPNGNLLVLVQETFGLYAMASLSVNKVDTTIDVTVKHIQYFRPAFCLFLPCFAKAMRLKNTGSDTDTMQGMSQICNELCGMLSNA